MEHLKNNLDFAKTNALKLSGNLSGERKSGEINGENN